MFQKLKFHSAAILAAGLFFSLAASAQTGRRSSAVATGRASVFTAPDQVKISATVTTQAPTAQDATSQNATRMTNLLAALRKVLGSTADIKTVNVSINPVYQNAPNQPPTVVAYSASNSVEVTLSVASTIGVVIDTAAQNGATSVGSLQFSLKDPEPTRLQALRAATQQAKTHVDAMAFALGRTIGNVFSIQESSTSTPIIYTGVAGGAAPTTPVEPGTVEVQATVVLEAELN